jgi:hypothetical protein
MLHALILGALVAQVPSVTPSPSIPPVTPAPSPAASGTPLPVSTATPVPGASVSPSPSPVPTGPRLTASPANVNLNPVQQTILSVVGATPPLQATLDQKLVNVVVSPTGATVTVTATQATGTDTLHLVDANGASVDVPIRVAFNAGTIVGQTTLQVTGNPVDPGWLARQVTRWVTNITQAMAGAQTTIGAVTAPAVPLQPGGTTEFTVPVQIAGNGQYFDLSGPTVVNVQNVPVAPFVPSLLFYDDDPEHVTQDGVLFRGAVSAAQPARLYYYHDDGVTPRRLVIALASNSQDPTSVQITDASAGPNIDVMSVGQAVTRNFLQTKTNDEGIIVNLPQDAPYLLSDIPLTSRQLAAGSVDFRVLSGGPIVVTVLTVSLGENPLALLDQPILSGDGHHRTGIFRLDGIGNASINYTAGGPDASVTIGGTDQAPPSADPNALGHDYGDYGVLQTIALTLANPTNASATAYLYFRPMGGVDRGSFLVDGNLVQIGCVRESVPYQVSAFDLAPGQTYHGVVQTMTDGGSFYPAEIGVTTTAPQPTAPPINAPDGCFPKPQISPTPPPS